MNVQTARLTTKVLSGACGALLLLAIAQYAGLGRGYHWAADGDAEGAAAALGRIDEKPVVIPPASTFAEIEAHPLFNEDRQPSAYAQGGAGGEEEAAPPQNPLNIALTGIILDDVNHVRIAMLLDKARNQPVALKVGMPLEGDQANWTLVDIKPRLAVFRSAANETTEVELETSVAQPAPQRPARPGVAGKPAVGGSPGAVPPRSAADPNKDLAQRIEERRRQMREDAEKARNGGKPPNPPPKK